MITLKKIQFWTGLTGIIIFLFSGQYMVHTLNVGNLEDSLRMIYRASHIYILLGSTINIIWGVYYTPPNQVKFGSWISPIFILLATVMLIYGFFMEATSGNIDKPITSVALYLIFAGIMIIVIKSLWDKLDLKPFNKKND